MGAADCTIFLFLLSIRCLHSETQAGMESVSHPAEDQKSTGGGCQ